MPLLVWKLTALLRWAHPRSRVTYTRYIQKEVLCHECEKIGELEFTLAIAIDHFCPLREFCLGWGLIEGSHEEWELLFWRWLTLMLTRLSLSLSKSWNAYLNSAIFSSLNLSPLSIRIIYKVIYPQTKIIQTYRKENIMHSIWNKNWFQSELPLIA